MEWYPCDFEANAEDARYINAGELVTYLHERFGEERMMELIGVQGDSVVRRWFRWRVEMEDGLLDVYSVDAFLIKVFNREVMLCDLPVECFSFRRCRQGVKRPKTSVEMRLIYGRKVVEDGESPIKLAKQLGFNERSLRNWAKLYEQQAVAA